MLSRGKPFRGFNSLDPPEMCYDGGVSGDGKSRATRVSRSEASLRGLSGTSVWYAPENRVYSVSTRNRVVVFLDLSILSEPRGARGARPGP